MLETDVSPPHAKSDRLLILLVLGTVFTSGFAASAWFSTSGSGVGGMSIRLLVSLLVGIEVTGYVGMLLVAITQARAWWNTVRLLGIPSLQTLRAFRVVAKSMRKRRDVVGFHLVLFFALFLALGLNISWRFLAFGVTFLCTYVLHFQSSVFRPAVALFLSTSTVSNVQLQASLIRANMNCRVVSLLDTFGLLDIRSPTQSWMEMVIGYDCLRTSRPEVWQKIVEILVRQVPLIIMDARTMTPAVGHESHRLLQSNALYKTLFVVGSDGEGPVLDALDATGSRAVCVATVREKDVVHVYEYVTRHKTRLPTLERNLVETLGCFANSDGHCVVTCRELSGAARVARWNQPLTQTQEALAGSTAPPLAATSQPHEVLIQDQRQGRGVEERKCRECGHVYPANRDACPQCGSAAWVSIVGGVLFGATLVLFALVYCESIWWKTVWLIIGGLNVFEWGKVWLRVIARKRTG